MTLCPESDFRAALSDEDFWAHVFAPWTGGLDGGRDYDPDDDPNAPEPDEVILNPCEVCGEWGPCGYDDQGRILVHWQPPDDGEEPAPWEREHGS